jgi:hypothetical protein
MAYTLTYRTCQAFSSEQEANLRRALDAFNQKRTWVLSIHRDDGDGHLACVMKCVAASGGEPVGEKMPQWPGAYEVQCLLDGLCGISRDCQVDWEIHDPYGLRPVGFIRKGQCHADPAAQTEALQNMQAVLRRRSSG